MLLVKIRHALNIKYTLDFKDFVLQNNVTYFVNNLLHIEIIILANYNIFILYYNINN